MTRQQAIRARCLDCSGGSQKDVRECPIKTCPLYPYRMRCGKGHKANAIYAYCLECSGGPSAERHLCPATKCSLHKYRNKSQTQGMREAKKGGVESTFGDANVQKAIRGH